MAYRLTRRARADMLAIWEYVAEQNEPAADRFIELATRKFQFLATHPHAGRGRDDIAPGYRSFPVGEYLIIYRAMKPGVRILHIFHGRRDLNSLLQN